MFKKSKFLTLLSISCVLTTTQATLGFASLPPPLDCQALHLRAYDCLIRYFQPSAMKEYESELARIYELDPSLRRYGLRIGEMAAIEEYTGGAFATLNPALWAGGSEQAKWQFFIDVIDDGLRKLPDYEGTVLRGATLPESVLSEHQPGNQVTYRAFTSTSRDIPFKGKELFTIRSHHGKRIETISGRGYEHEVLFMPATRFYINKREDLGDGTIQIDMEEVR